MFGAWTLSLIVCLTAEESNASQLPMTSATSALILQWTLESPANMSQGFWIRLQFLEATQLQFAQITVRNSQAEPSWLGPLCMAFATVKNALYPILEEELKGLRYPSDDMLRTLFFEVAGLLNTRPLTYVSCDPDDFRPITLNDFLNRAPMADLPAGDFTRSLPRDHYRYVQRMVNLFWDLWHGAFLQSMVGRNKWTTPARNLAVGDVVLDDWKDAPRARWRMGRVTRVYPGADGLVRAVDVEFSTGVLRRGSNQLALLEASSTVPASGEDGAAISTRTEK